MSERGLSQIRYVTDCTRCSDNPFPLLFTFVGHETQDVPDGARPATLILHSGAPEGQPEGEKTDA